eukprot:1160888-Pelagomonas_calceolata.AAC.4
MKGSDGAGADALRWCLVVTSCIKHMHMLGIALSSAGRKCWQEVLVGQKVLAGSANGGVGVEGSVASHVCYDRLCKSLAMDVLQYMLMLWTLASA